MVFAIYFIMPFLSTIVIYDNSFRTRTIIAIDTYSNEGFAGDILSLPNLVFTSEQLKVHKNQLCHYYATISDRHINNASLSRFSNWLMENRNRCAKVMILLTRYRPGDPLDKLELLLYSTGYLPRPFITLQLVYAHIVAVQVWDA